MKGWGVFNGIEGKFLAEVRKVGRGVAQKNKDFRLRHQKW